MSSNKGRDPSLGPKLDRLEEQLEVVREEICDVPHVSELNTGEMIRVEETLAIAAEAAKEVITLRRRIRRDEGEGGDTAG